MKNLIKISFLTLLTLIISGCAATSLTNKAEPIIDENVEYVDSKSIKAIADINSVALEWKKVDDLRVVGYNIYRADTATTAEGNRFQEVGFAQNRYTTHYVDRELKADTEYSYVLSSKTESGSESRPTKIFKIKTLPTLPPVAFVQAISNMPNQIKILWRPHESERVGQYLVEKASPNQENWKKLKTIDGRLNIEYIDTNLKNNEEFFYRVTAITYDNLSSQPSEVVKASSKELPLGANNIVATTNQPKKITITWEASPTPDVIGYSLYSSDKDDGKYKIIQHFNSIDNTFIFEDDVQKDGVVKYYKVTATDKDGLESALNVNSVMGSSLPLLAKPVIILAQIQDERVIINWQPGDNRAVKYNVYKTASRSFTASNTTQFKDITELRFEDIDITRGIQYTYIVQSIDEFGILSKGSEEIKLTLPKLKIDE